MHYGFQFWTALLCLLVILICDINISIISRYIVQYISIWNKQNIWLLIIVYRLWQIILHFCGKFSTPRHGASTRPSHYRLAIAIKDDPNSLDKYLLRMLPSCSILAASIPCLLLLNVRSTQNISACGSVFIAIVPIHNLYLISTRWYWVQADMTVVPCGAAATSGGNSWYKKDTHNIIQIHTLKTFITST